MEKEKVVFNPNPDTPNPDENINRTVDIDGVIYDMDSDGNALDSNKEIFKTKEEIDNFNKSKKVDDSEKSDETEKPDESKESDESKEPEEIEEVILIGDDGKEVKYSLDKEGNAIDSDGKVIHTKEELLEFEKEDVKEDDKESFKVTDLISKTNIPILDDNGNPVTYEDTEEGLVKYVNDVFEEATTTGVEQLFNTYPDIADLYNHIRINGTSEGFNSMPKYEDLELDKSNKEQLKSIITTAWKKRGNTDNQIARYLASIEASDKDNDDLYKEAQQEKEFLSGIVSKQREEEKLLLEQEQQRQMQEQNSFWGVKIDEKTNQLVDLNVPDSVYNIVHTGKIQTSSNETFTIPEKIKVVEGGKIKYYNRNDFFEYLFVPKVFNENGERIKMTKYDYDLAMSNNKRTKGDDILDAFKLFTNYDTTQFIKEQVNNEKVKRIRMRKKKSITTFSDDNSKDKKNTKGKVVFDPNR